MKLSHAWSIPPLALGLFLLSGCAGSDGSNGASCTVQKGSDSATIICDDGTEVTLHDGDPGLPGDPGDPGAPGEDGSSCSITSNGDGTKTISCDDGTTATVTDGVNGASCLVTGNDDGSSTISCGDGSTVTVKDGRNALDVAVKNFHGTDRLLTSGEFDEAGKYFVTADITSATADAAGKVVVNFTVVDEDDFPVSDLASISANIDKLVPGSPGEASNKWVPYIYSTQTVSGSGDWPAPAGTKWDQPSSESSTSQGNLINHGDGTYTYEFGINISNVIANGAPVAYERSRTHRVSIMMGGHSGATDDAVFDFVPDGSSGLDTREIVRTESCQACHGWEFHGHGGNRLTVQNCQTCHVPGAYDPHGADGAGFPGETLDLKVMIHKIHAGAELASIPGADGAVFNNPATPQDETADNGEYAIWGYRNTKHEWWGVEFPAVIENCTKCHSGEGADKDNWKTKPSRAACGSCHDTVNFETGLNHGGGIRTDDNSCTVCHQASGTKDDIVDAHDWTRHDPRNIPEFTAELTVSTPPNGHYFRPGEAPVVTLVLKDNGVAIDHTTVVEDDNGAEGCKKTDETCPPRDGKFTTAALFVHGPRAHRVPVLTTAARAQILAPTAGPFDLSASSAGLVVKVDGGAALQDGEERGGDDILGLFTVAVPNSGTFADKAAATTDEVVAWLNGNAAFKLRAIASNEGGKVLIRSRNLGPVHSIEVLASVGATQIFGGEKSGRPTGSTTANNVSARTNASNNDPKATRTADAITYQLDAVDDLEPGTYVASIEFTDGGRKNAEDYRTPTVAFAEFQVKTEDEEPPVARNCDTCHQSEDGKGFILDHSRHNKIFRDKAVDQCGACHDYQPQNASDPGWTGWSGARPISRRVHGIHYGSSLNYPLATVDYGNGDPVAGRNWEITLPQDVRNCEVCHTEETSGTWATNPNRVACQGCHDSDAARAHVQAMTFDPTPSAIWSGDERESCKVCH